LKTAVTNRSNRDRLRSGRIRKRVERRITISSRSHVAIAVAIHALRKRRKRRMRKTKIYGMQSGGNGIRNLLAKIRQRPNTAFHKPLAVPPLYESRYLCGVSRVALPRLSQTHKNRKRHNVQSRVQITVYVRAP
jgi:hypothetical protein